MNDLDEASLENHSELSDIDQLTDGSDELSEVDDEELFSDIIKEGGAKKPNVLDSLLIQDETENLSIGDDDDEEEEDEEYLKKFDKDLRKNYLVDFHPEVITYNNLEIQTMSEVIRDPVTKIIIDDFHKTLPFLTKYEKTRILGLRAKQIDNGAKPFINYKRFNLIDGYVIAQKELERKKLPFIVRRPLPNGGSEFWKLKDLQMIH
jgi:DNA-directed RNA polymerase I, II, and III subunit RPABC2